MEEAFESVLQKAPSLTDSDKLRYLQSAVKSKEGQAIISTISVDGEGYKDVASQLKQHFDLQSDSYRQDEPTENPATSLLFHI